MKRIVISLFLLISISAFSQSEIWGTKYHAGKKNGGVLFSIDSATNQIITQHRFECYDYNYGYTTFVIPPFYDAEKNIWLIAERNNQILIYHPAIDLVERIDYGGEISGTIYGKFTKGLDNNYYIFHEQGLLKIDISSKEVKICKTLDKYNSIRGEELSRFENKLYWHQQNGTTDLLIYTLDLQTDSVELLLNKDIAFRLLGKLNFFNGKLYGSYYSNDAYQIYSYDINSNSFSQEYSIGSDQLKFSYPMGIELAKDQKFYAVGNVQEGNSIDYLFSFDPVTDSFRIITAINSNQGNGIKPYFLAHDDEGFYMQFNKGGEFSYGSILRYNFHEDSLSIVYSFTENSLLSLFHSNEKDKIQAVLSTQTTQFNQYLIDLNLFDSSFDTIKRILKPEFTEGFYPKKIIQLENGLIIGNTAAGGMYNGNYYDYISKSKGVLFQFDPLTREYKVLFDFNESFIDYYGSGTIYNLAGNDFLLNIYNLVTNQYILFSVNSSSLEIDSLGQIPSGFYLQNSDSSFLIYGAAYLNKYHIYSHNIDSIYLFNEEFTLSKVLKSDNNYVIVETRSRDSLYQMHSQIQKLFLKEKKLELVRNLILPKDHDSESSPYFNKLMMTADSNLVGIVSEGYEAKAVTLSLIKYNLSNDSIQVLLKDSFSGVGYTTEEFDFILIDDYKMKGNVYSLSYRNANNWGTLNLHDFESDTVIFCDIMEDMAEEYEYECEDNNCGYKSMTRFKKNPDSYYWTGIVSSDWYTKENWKFNLIPDSSSNVNINSYTPFFPIIDTNVFCHHLTINSDTRLFITESGIFTSKSLSNNGTIEMFANDSLRASAIFTSNSNSNHIELYYVNQYDTINGVFAIPSQLNPINKNEDFQLFHYNITNDWIPVENYPYNYENNEVLKIKSRDTTLLFNGTYHSGPQTLVIPQLNQASLYPLPNPYPSSIDWQKADLSSLTHKAFYFFNEKDSSFSAFVDGLGNRSPLIRPLDAFWVWTDGAESIQLDNTSRVHEAEFKEETPNKKYLSLQVIGGKGTDETVIGFNENASFDFDPEYDAFKFVRTTHFAPHIFSNTENELLSVNQLPDTSMMDLFVLSGEDETLKIELAENNGFDFLVLEDLIWNTRIDLLKNDYSFDYFKSDGHYPFKLYFTPWALEPIEEVDIQMYYYPEFLVIKSRKPIDYAEITLYDLAGRAVLEFHEQDFYYIKKPIHIPTGHYIAQFRSGDLVVNKKILVRK